MTDGRTPSRGPAWMFYLLCIVAAAIYAGETHGTDFAARAVGNFVGPSIGCYLLWRFLWQRKYPRTFIVVAGIVSLLLSLSIMRKL